MAVTVTRKRVEILIDTPLLPRLVQLLEQVGILGWSLLHVDAGRGRVGEWHNDEITGATTKTIVLTIASETKAALLLDALAPILDSHGLLVTLSDVQVIRGDRFT